MAGWRRRLLLRSYLVRQREWRQGGLLRIAGHRCWSADRSHLQSQRRLSGLREPQGLQGIRRRAPPRRLERVGHARNLAGRRKKAARVEAAAHRKIAPAYNSKKVI